MNNHNRRFDWFFDKSFSQFKLRDAETLYFIRNNAGHDHATQTAVF